MSITGGFTICCARYHVSCQKHIEKSKILNRQMTGIDGVGTRHSYSETEYSSDAGVKSSMKRLSQGEEALMSQSLLLRKCRWLSGMSPLPGIKRYSSAVLFK